MAGWIAVVGTGTVNLLVRCRDKASVGWVKGGRWIGYTAAQASLRRAARLACTVTVLGGAGDVIGPRAIGGDLFPPGGAVPAWTGAPGPAALYVPVGEGFVPIVSGFVPTPGTTGPASPVFAPEERTTPNATTAEPAGLLTLALPAAAMILLLGRKR